jgi:hypothetical protein
VFVYLIFFVIFAENYSMANQIYKPQTIKMSNELEIVSSMIYFYSCYRVMRGYSTSPLKMSLINLLALYVIYGYTRETRKMAEDIFFKGREQKDKGVNSFNSELRRAGYLVVDDKNSRINHLIPPLEKLRSLYLENLKEGKDVMFILHFQLDDDGTIGSVL